MGDLFYVSTGSLISSERLKPGKIKRVSAKSDQNGIIGEFDTEFMDDARHYENFISVNFFGDVFYHPYCASVEMKVHVLTLKQSKSGFNAKCGLYVASMLNKALRGRFNYGQQLSSSKLRDGEYFITLPVKNNEIDFEFMDNYIEELEAAHIEELEAYLLVSGLADSRTRGLADSRTRGLISYELTPQESNILDKIQNGGVSWEMSPFDCFFDNIKQGKRLKKQDHIKGDIPFVMAGITNNGVANFISNPHIIFPKNSITVDIFGNVFYRSYEFGAGDDTGVYWNDKERHSKENMLFLATSMACAIKDKYDYGRKLRSSQSKEIKMAVISKNGFPDYSAMKDLIYAVQKLVIKDVVEYADKKLSAYRQVTSTKGV
ncbi:type II restriction endonuclease subunit R [Escherichia coli]|nr:type II restriction endonuclease subunit R [Escherichia coli]